MFNATINAPPAAPTRTPAYGLLKAKSGSSHFIRCKDGKKRYFTVRELRTFPKCKPVAKCLHPECAGKEWPSYSALEKDHDATEIMVRQQEAHVYVLLSEETDTDGKLIGLLSDE